MHTHTYSYAHIHIHKHTHTQNTHTHTHAHIYTHTYTHTLTHVNLATSNIWIRAPKLKLLCAKATLCYRSKTLYHTEKREFGCPGFHKEYKTHPPKPAEVEPSFRKVSLYSLQNYICFSPLTSGLEFWPQIYSLSQALDWGLQSKILASTKMGRA